MGIARLFSAVGVTVSAAALALGMGVAPAAAHVVPDPGEAPKGSVTSVAFRSPNESTKADIVKVALEFPLSHPVAAVRPQLKAGWAISIDKVKPAKAVRNDEGAVAEVVRRVTWSGGKIPPGQYDDFTVSMGPLPTDTDQLVFTALQTDSAGAVVRWADQMGAGGKEPDHPAPTLMLGDASTGERADAHGMAVTTVAPASNESAASVTASGDVASKSAVDQARTIGIIGIMVGVVGLIAAAVSLSYSRRERQ